jgi:hypothetical protein
MYAAALLLSLSASAAERTLEPMDALAVGASSFGGGAVGVVGGAAAGIGVANLVCSTNGHSDGAMGCIFASATIGGALGFGTGTLLAGPWMAGRRGLDHRLVRRRTWIALGAGFVLTAATLGAASPAVLIGVPLVAALAARKPERLSVAPLVSSEVKGLALSGHF